MHRTLRALVAAVAVFALASTVQAADLQLYVKNRPFTGPTTTRQGQVHAALDGVLQALGYSWRLTGDRVDVSRTAGGGPTLPAGSLQLFLDGQALSVPVVDVQGKAFVNVATLAKAMSLYYSPNAALGTADLGIPVSRDQVADNWGREPEKTETASGGDQAADASGKPSAEGKPAEDKPAAGDKPPAKQEMIETDGTNKKSPIQVVNTSFSDSTTPGTQFVGEVRVSTTIKNKSDEQLEKVTLFLRLVNLAGETVQEWKHDIGVMKPGAEVSFTPEPPVWYNYNKIQVEPKVVVKHLSLPEPEEDEAPKDGGK